MYWGGDIIYAADCDYDSCRDRGTICPYCSSAVHIRAKSERSIKGKKVLVDAYFAHYKAGSDTDWCEARAKSAQSKDDIERLKMVAKGQRLELFNNKLWEIHAGDRNIRPRKVKEIREAFGGQTVARMLPGLRQCFRQNRDFLVEEGRNIVEHIITGGADMDKEFIAYMAPAICSEGDARAEIKKQREYYTKSDQKLHIEISIEVIDFLFTNSGGYALERFALLALEQIGGILKCRSLSELWTTKELNRLCCAVIVCTVVGTHWGEAIARAGN